MDRNDSLAIAIVTAPASTARPASCPPMRRASNGTVDAASAACNTVRALPDGRPGVVLGSGVACTVGNRPEGLVGETPVPEMGGRLVPGGRLAEELGMAVLAATTTSDAVPLNDRAPEAVASAEICTSAPTVALDRTRTAACSSAAWPTGRSPTAQEAPFGTGHTVNVVAPTLRRAPTLARTVTASLAAPVDQTQITKPALWPALTSPALERGWTRTHSCGVTRLCFGLGLGVDELGFGLGVLVAVSLGVGLVDAGVDVAGTVDVAGLVEVAGLDDADELAEGLLLAELRDDADALAEPDMLAELVVADDLADLKDDADEMANAAPGWCLAALFVAPESTVLFGMSGQAAELMID